MLSPFTVKQIVTFFSLSQLAQEFFWVVYKIKSVVLKKLVCMALSALTWKQRRIQNPAKHLMWSFSQKCYCIFFLKKASSLMFDKVLRLPLGKMGKFYPLFSPWFSSFRVIKPYKSFLAFLLIFVPAGIYLLKVKNGNKEQCVKYLKAIDVVLVSLLLNIFLHILLVFSLLTLNK